MKNNIGAIWIGLMIISIIGFAGLTIVEILLLKKKNWLDGKISVRYPVITNLVNIPVTAIAYLISVWILFIVAFIVMGTIDLKFKDYPNVVEAAGIVFYIFVVVFPFFIYLTVFSLVRLLTTNIMAKSSNMTWKYTFGQSALLAGWILIISFLLTATFYL